MLQVPLLLDNSISEDDGVRTIVAECLGKFVTVDLEAILPRIVEFLLDPDHKRCGGSSKRVYIMSILRGVVNSIIKRISFREIPMWP